MENNYTVTMPNDGAQPPGKVRELTWKQLRQVDHTFTDAFILQLANDERLQATQIARILPKKRLVIFGTWQDKPIVAKLFFHAKHAKRDMEREMAGVRILQENSIPTPQLYQQTISHDQHVYILIFEQILAADVLDIAHLDKQDDSRLKMITEELATQHVLGIIQHDLHLKNFLLTEKKIYTLDGAQIEKAPYLLPKKISMQYLALFFAQLGVGMKEQQIALFHYYARLRGWRLKKQDVLELFLLIKKVNEARWLSFAKKIFRNCTDFARISHWKIVGMYHRISVSPQLFAAFKNPETLFNHPTATKLKTGRSTTVVKVTLDQRDYVIKRYNLKTSFHYLRRCLRPTRAAHCWRLAQKMNLFGLITAKPVAFIEKRYFGLRGVSYYITEYVQGEQADRFLAHADEVQTTQAIQHVSRVLKNLPQINITHGDLKITNILINQQLQPVLIDLDGAAEHFSLSSLRGTWHKEIKRFLRNFHDNPTL
ncbi:MAG TPA: lipopolysaccharide kinase InaA family protein, partial [Gammaproteobacteria bacterium]|nr:lipopolysaccharide kinase InaA family protein [Gammaproteobacteria bacterium]